MRLMVLPTLLVLLQFCGGTISWAQQSVPVVAAGATDGRARLVVEATNTAGSRPRPQSVFLTAQRQTQLARPGPLLFDRLTAALCSRYLLTRSVPDNLPRPALVRVATPSGALTADTKIFGQVGGGTGAALPVIIAAIILTAVALLAGVEFIAGKRWRAPLQLPLREQPEAGGYDPPPAATASPDQPEHRAWNVPSRVEPAIERKPLLAAIGRTLREGRPVVLAPREARSGLGVTTAMIEFAHRNREEYDIVWWIAAQDPQLVGEQMAQLAEAIGLAAPTDTPGQATPALLDALGQRSRWLLVFDDAESRHQLARFLPAGSGHVLIASNDLTWSEQVAPLVVSPFTRDQSVQLLCARHSGLRPNQARRVAALLEDLPLTVDVAAATLAESGMGVDAYLRLACESPSSAVWSVAFEQLAADDPPALALLTLLAWLGPEPFPLSLLTRHPDLMPAALAGLAPSRPQLAERAATLQRRSLVRVHGEIVQVHRTTAAQLTRRTLEDRPDGMGWATRVVRVLQSVAPADPADPAGWPLWRQLLPHVLAVTDPARLLDDVTAEVAWLLDHGAGFLLARGEPRPALALAKDSYDLYRHRLGPDHPDTQTSARTLTDSLHALGRHAQARHTLEEARTDAATDPRWTPRERSS
jgi:hypothetical protein